MSQNPPSPSTPSTAVPAESAPPTAASPQTYDVVVIGGGPAGLSGAQALVRFRRSVLVIDSGAPRNATAGHVHNFLSRDGTPPADLLALGRAEVESYGGQVISGEVTAAGRSAAAESGAAESGAAESGLGGAGFDVELADGRRFSARRLLVTTGLVDQLPDLPGVRELWGRDVLHCPYCHGWEVRDQAVGILASTVFAAHQAQLFRQLTDDVIVFTQGVELPAEQVEQLTARGIGVVTEEVAELVVDDGRLAGVRLQSGEVIPRQAVAVGPQVVARAGFLVGLGIDTVGQEMNGVSLGQTVPTDPMGATSVPGVWAAGNVTDLRGQVISSAGLNAAAAINADLITEEIQLSVELARGRQLVG